MKKDSALVGLGVLVVIVPFLGIPSLWKTVIFVILGVAVVALALLMKRDGNSSNTEAHSDVYVENGHTRKPSYHEAKNEKVKDQNI